MPARRAGPQRVKQHWSYSIPELAACVGVHKNTVRHWQRAGLKPIDTSRPVLFHGADVKAFLAARKQGRKRPCPPGMIYCLRCREPRRPALEMVDYIPINAASGNLRALCNDCGGLMHRRARRADLTTKMPGISVQITEAPARLSDRPVPSLNCDFKRKVKP